MTGNCCENCFNDTYVVSYIRRTGKIGICDYCNSKYVKIKDVNIIAEVAKKGLLKKYEDAVESIPYESREEGYLLPSSNCFDIVEKEKLLNTRYKSFERLFEDLFGYDDTPYVRKDYFGPPTGSGDDIESWEYFCETIKHNNRFTAFYSITTDPDSKLSHFIKNVLTIFNSEKLLSKIRINKKIYRARIFNNDFTLDNNSLTAPPPESAKANRMSPDGIPFFYGCFGKSACIYEVRPSLYDKVAVGEFETIKDLNLLNLANKLDSRINLFDPKYEFYFEEFVRDFLIHFAKDINRPILNESSKVEYIPTQAFIEFIRFHSSKKYDGIIFNSSVKFGAKNIVLFKGKEISDPNSKDALLKFNSAKIYDIFTIDYHYVEKK